MNEIISFSDTMHDTGIGGLCETELRKVLKACKETGKVGELNLKIKIRPGGEGRVAIQPIVKAVIPVNPPNPIHMFVKEDDMGLALTVNDDKQTTIDDVVSVPDSQNKNVVDFKTKKQG